jgi:hypothetical protein
MKFFDYCFYRILSYYIKRKVDKHPLIYTTGWVTLGQSCNIITIVTLFCFIFDIKYDFKTIWTCLVIIVYLINDRFLLTYKKYEKLSEIYKDEKHKKLKGWGVFSYIIVSILLFIAVNIPSNPTN